MALGPVMLDLAATELGAEERDVLRHPAVGGVILFSRNYESPEQIARLVEAVHAVREPQLLVAVDQEGGRVQRFRRGFTSLPAPARLGEIFDRDPARARELARDGGWLMAAELRAVGVDFSFAPVLDLGSGHSTVIGDRAFHRDPETVATLANAYVRGMADAGMAAVGKHFPGHGTVALDSHVGLPEDDRDLDQVRASDLIPFERLVHFGIPGVMAAHVVFPDVDSEAAGFSKAWIRGVLRAELGFQGAVFSDDLCMAAASVGGDHLSRARRALAAGCDMALVCNEPDAARAVVDGLDAVADPLRSARLARLHGRRHMDREALRAEPRYQRARAAMSELNPEPELDLGEDTVM